MCAFLGMGISSSSSQLGRLKANFGKTFSEEAEKVIGNLVAKNVLGVMCAHENDTYKLFLLVLTTTFALLPRVLSISYLNRTFHCCTNLPLCPCV